MAIMKNSYHPHYHTPKHGAGIGLGIVAALDVKPASTTGEMSILIKHSVAVSPQPSPRSDPVPVITNRTRTRTPHHDDEDDDDYFSYVTSRGPTNSSVTRVYHHPPSGDGGVLKTPKPFKYPKTEKDHNNTNNNNNNNNKKSDFLSSCDMCSKSLEGKDIYMYRGEKAFCSGECRERQIASDERKEKMCRLSKRKAAASSSSEMVVSRSPCYYETGQIFTTGIIATY